MNLRNVSKSLAIKTVTAIALLFLGAVAQASEPVFVSDDTFVQPANIQGDTSNNSFGDNPSILLKNNGTVTSPVNTRLGFLRFDLSGLTAPFVAADGLNVAVNANNNGTAGTVQTFEFEIWGLKENPEWSEDNLTWNTADANLVRLGQDFASQAAWGFDPDDLFGTPEPSPLATCTTPAQVPTFKYFCTSPELVAYMNSNLGEGSVTLALRRTDTNPGTNFAFHSKEASGSLDSLSTPANGGSQDQLGFFTPMFGPAERFLPTTPPLPVPTLPFWSLMILIGLLGMAGVRQLHG